MCEPASESLARSAQHRQITARCRALPGRRFRIFGCILCAQGHCHCSIPRFGTIRACGLSFLPAGLVPLAVLRRSALLAQLLPTLSSTRARLLCKLLISPEQHVGCG